MISLEISSVFLPNHHYCISPIRLANLLSLPCWRSAAIDVFFWLYLVLFYKNSPILDCFSFNSVFLWFHSQVALHAAVPLAPLWDIFNTNCAKENCFEVFLLCSLPLIRCAPNQNCSVLLYKRCYCYEMVWKLLRCSPVMILEDKHRQQWVCFELWTFLASYVLQLINHTSFVAGKYFISMTEKKTKLLTASY